MDTKGLVPLMNVVSAAIVDTYKDKGKVEQLYAHHAARGLKWLNFEVFKRDKKRPVLLSVNQNTLTATLPPDFEEEIFIGVLINGIKIPLKRSGLIVDSQNIDDTQVTNKCPKCNANKAACNDLTLSVDTNIVTINAVNYEQTVTKKMYPNGDFFLETNIPYLDIDTNTVVFRPSKEFVAHIDLKPCGCVAETESNMQTIASCCPDVYCQYYSGIHANASCGDYEIFKETGLIQFSSSFKFNKVYMEYRGFMLKINGQYYVPEVAFETLVEWTKWKAIKDKLSVSRLEKQAQKQDYKEAKQNMKVVISRTSLERIMNAVFTTPKFDIYIENFPCLCGSAAPAIPSVPSNVCAVSNTPSSTTTINNGGGGGGGQSGYVPFSIGVIVGIGNAPSDGTSVWQANFLKGALNLNYLFVMDTTYTLAKGDFTFDPVTGTIDISPNKWYNGDVIVGNYFKLL